MSEERKRFTGRDVTEALSAARRHFDRTRRELGFEVIDQPKVGPVAEVTPDLVTIEAWPETREPSGGAPPEPRRDERGPRGRDRDRGPRRDGDRRPPRREAPAPEVIELPDIVPGEDVTEPDAVLRHVVDTMLKGLDLELSITSIESSEAGWRVNVDGADAELLTEEKAEGLDAFQYLVNRFLHKDPREIGRVLVDAGGHRARYEQGLVDDAKALAEEVKSTGSKREMPPLGPFERRIVHLALKEVEGIRTFSSGHGYRRRVNIAPDRGEGESDD